jgi:hypothetical protein
MFYVYTSAKQVYTQLTLSVHYYIMMKCHLNYEFICSVRSSDHIVYTSVNMVFFKCTLYNYGEVDLNYECFCSVHLI